jgi:hypothetical protein
MQEHRHKTWAESAGLPETAVRLDRLPAGVEFPEDFPEPIRFDPRRSRLVYRGFMTSNSYRFLHAQSSDLAYLAALDALFLDSSYTMAGASSGGKVWRWLLGAAIVAAAAAVAWLLRR